MRNFILPLEICFSGYSLSLSKCCTVFPLFYFKFDTMGSCIPAFWVNKFPKIKSLFPP